MVARRLIINADDLGYSRGVNEAIVRCARRGVLSSATIMAGGPAFEHAVELLRELPDLGIGVHLTLTELRSVVSATRLPGLVEPSGKLPSTAQALYARVTIRRSVRDSLLRELSGQMEKVLGSGIRPTHVDTHKHVHAFPVLLDLVLKVAKRYGVRWVRNPYDDTPFSAVALTVPPADRRTYWVQSTAARAVRVLKPYFLARVSQAGMRSPEHLYGVGLTGVWSQGALAALIPRLPSGVSEIMFHPGDCDAGLRGCRTRLLHQREGERDLLLSPFFRDLMGSHGLSLVRFGEVMSWFPN